MNFDQLRYFREINATGSFTKAAENLFITQAGLTYQIKQLESELGFKLLDRDSHHVTLTEQGQMLAPVVDGILDAWDREYEKTVLSLKEGEANLRIGMIDFMDNDLLLHANRAFRELHPNCTVIPQLMKPLMHQEYISRLISNRLDLIYIYDDEISSMTTIAFEPLCPLRYGAYMRVDDPLAKRKQVCFEDFAGRTVLLPEALMQPENKRRYELTTKRFSLVRPLAKIIYVPDLDSARIMIGDIGAISIQAFAAAEDIYHPGLVLVPIEDDERPVSFGIAYQRNTSNPLTLDYVRLCKELYANRE